MIMENFVINYAKKSFGSILGIFTQKKAFFRSEIKNLHREFQKLSTYMKPEGLYLDFAQFRWNDGFGLFFRYENYLHK